MDIAVFVSLYIYLSEEGIVSDRAGYRWLRATMKVELRAYGKAVSALKH